MSETVQPHIFWSQSDSCIFLRIDISNPQGTEIQFGESSMSFSAYRTTKDGPVNYTFTLDLFDSTILEENVYEMINNKLQFWIIKKTKVEWPRLIKSEIEFPWIVMDDDKSGKKNRKKERKNEEEEKKRIFENLCKGYTTANEKLHKEVFEKRNLHEDYPHMYDRLHKEEFGYRKEELKKVYLVLYNLCQFVGFIYILTIMAIRYSREGPDSMKETYNNVGSIMKFIQILQFLEVMHPMFGYTKGSALVALLQVGGRAFILFGMIEGEPRMQTKPVVFYVFFVWSLVEVFRYPYYITQLLNSEIPLLTWFRYTIWIPLYPLGFLCEGIIVLRNIPYFEETNNFTVSLPNSWNFSFHYPTFLRIYLLTLCVPGMYTMMNHMHKTRYRKLGKSKKQKDAQKKL